MDLGLKDKVVLITGGAKGIGRACVRLFAEEGARVILVDRDAEAGQLAADEQNARFFQTDLAEEGACKKVVESSIAEFGGVDILINNAGFNDAVGLSGSVEDFRKSLDLNLVPAFELAKHLSESLRERCGNIINIGSKVALTGQGSTSGYAASKGGINALTREWAAAFASSGVRVNAVLPAECLTDQYERWFESLDDPQGTRKRIEAMVPLGKRMTSPEELAATVVFLASDRSSHTTAQIMLVDGGYTHLDRAIGHDHAKWD